MRKRSEKKKIGTQTEDGKKSEMWKWQWRSNPNQIETESQTKQRTKKHRIESNRIERSVKWMSAAILPPVEWITNWFQALDERILNGIAFSIWFRICCFLPFFFRHRVVVTRSLSFRPFRVSLGPFSSNPVLSIITVRFSLFELASVFICSVCLLCLCVQCACSKFTMYNSKCIIPLPVTTHRYFSLSLDENGAKAQQKMQGTRHIPANMTDWLTVCIAMPCYAMHTILYSLYCLHTHVSQLPI